MKAYTTKWAAIIGLHERGFTEDFKLSGNSVLWVQQGVRLLPKEITLVEFYGFSSATGNRMLIVAVIANHLGIKGILINHQKDYADKMIPVINNMVTKTSQILMKN
jgi:hypothetical protein